MFLRNTFANWRLSAQPLGAVEIWFAKAAQVAPYRQIAPMGNVHQFDCQFDEFLCECPPTLRPACPPGGPDFCKLSGQGRGGAGAGQRSTARFPFISRRNTLESASIKTLSRGLAECVSSPFLRRQLSLWPLRAASPITPTRLPTTPQCVQSAVQRRALSLQMQLAAAKPRARLSAHLLAACHVACRACLPATKQVQTASVDLPRFRGETIQRTTRAARRGGLFAFHAACVT